jgi:ribonuclease P/MRP protein subunit RPP40
LIIPSENKTVIKKINELAKNTFYYLVETSLVHFLDKDWMSNLMKRGQFYALACDAHNDSPNTWAILPTGKLWLSLDKETYEQFGLEGQASSFLKNRRHSIL